MAGNLALPPKMSALDPTTQAFPKLTAAQVERVKHYGKVREVQVGDILFQPGDSHLSLFLVLSGKLSVVQPDGEKEIPVVDHGPSQFTGELNMISGRPSLVRGRVTEAGEFVEVKAADLRAMISKEADLSEVLMRAFILRRLRLIEGGVSNVVMLGSRHCSATLKLREFLGRNGHPYKYIDLDTDEQAQELLDRFSVKPGDVPLVICHGDKVLRSPTVQKLADCLGFNESVNPADVRDVIVVGAGPAGLASAVYAASEGLAVLVLETNAPGGQAGTSSKIENYLGFPLGISGNELAARALAQAQKFGAEMLIASSAVKLHCSRHPYEIELEGGNTVKARTVVVASGAQYNRPNIENLSKFDGVGVYYGATFMEAQLCTNEEVIVVGGGNSAGQAAVFLSETTKKVYMLVRSGGLSDTMSRYLIQRIEENPQIELIVNTEIVAMEGTAQLERVRWRNRKTEVEEWREIRHVFMMTGAMPHTEWLQGCIELDAKGFIVTGRDLTAETLKKFAWPLRREPYMLETSLPGVFAVGDARAENVKRVAAAVGEGSIAVHLVHRALAEL
jgi:thioredoxin reductase (NADPH)